MAIMKRTARSALVGLMVLSWTSIASANDPSGQTHLVEIGAYIGALFPSASHELYDFPNVSHKSFNKAAVDFGLRLGYLPWSWVGVEVEGGAMPTSIRDADESATLYTVRGHLLMQFPWVVCPFVVGGGGILGVGSSAQAVGDDIDPAGYWGGGIKWYASPSFAVRVDARHIMSDGLGDDTIAHHVEVLGGLSWVIGWAEQKAAPADTDGDGVSDDRDRCPTEPATTADGCPPPADQDGDGVPDAVDRCPSDAARTSDGCPPDGDNDGVPDASDQCPDRPGTAETKGCPPDGDNDGIVDADDKCPNEPETKNGYEDQDGCPDELPKQVQQFAGTIKGISFGLGSARIKRSSFALLNRAVEVLQQYPDLRLQIRGHSDSTGSRERNMQLSGERADAVKSYLTSRGVAQARFTTEGVGPDEPVADNTTAKGRAQNRRIEFKILSD